ncbi:MAG TPA: PA0069 family radical SAM protein [Burkholderiales bacterium]|nr:PA0069 family radical SAM protein [Burkholderiales bacterium]
MDAKQDSRYLRGARSFVQGRFETSLREPFDDGWTPEERDAQPLETQVTEERARSIISHNDSPDVGFDQSINPYRGCEHGCIYCYARPSHAYLELSPGLDFETKLYAKTNAPELLREELSRKGYKPSPIALGANTDCYQPIERKYKITRGILEVLSEFQHPVTMVTKSALIERDLDILAPMAAKNLVKVFVSIGSLDRALARKLEPRAASPQRRLDILKKLTENQVPCGVLVAALIPALNDKTLEHVLEAASAAGAREAAYVIMRLPNELKVLFKEWLATHYPERAEHVISIVRQMRGGRDNDPNFGSRMSGTGKFAELVEKRFEIACRRLGLNDHGAGRERPALDCSLFKVPAGNGKEAGGQMALF